MKGGLAHKSGKTPRIPRCGCSIHKDAPNIKDGDGDFVVDTVKLKDQKFRPWLMANDSCATSPCEARLIWDGTFSVLELHVQMHVIHVMSTDRSQVFVMAYFFLLWFRNCITWVWVFVSQWLMLISQFQKQKNIMQSE
jgi:hypothetical protein